MARTRRRVQLVLPYWLGTVQGDLYIQGGSCNYHVNTTLHCTPHVDGTIDTCTVIISSIKLLRGVFRHS